MADEDQGKKYDEESFERLKAKHADDIGKLARLLHEDAWKARRRANALEGKVPPEGSIVLTSEQGKAWDSYQKLGAPAEVSTALGRLPDLESQVSRYAQDRIASDTAKLYGFDADVLASLVAKDKLGVLLKEIQKDGKPVQVALVKDGDKETPLDEYAAERWPKFMPALKPGENGGSSGAGIGYVNQSSGGKAPKADPFAAYAAKTYGTPKQNKE